MATVVYHELIKGWVKAVITFTADSSGDDSVTLKELGGELVKGLTNPGAGTAPTDDYDIVITDEDSLNILSACQDDLLNRDTSTTEEEYFLVLDDAGTPLAQGVHPVFIGKLTVTISNAGNGGEGVIKLYIRVA